jgi:glycine C-acetyltransferase
MKTRVISEARWKIVVLLKLGIYVIGFSFPVVPQGQARIRTQMSAGLTRQQLDDAVEAFSAVGKELGVIN